MNSWVNRMAIYEEKAVQIEADEEQGRQDRISFVKKARLLVSSEWKAWKNERKARIDDCNGGDDIQGMTLMTIIDDDDYIHRMANYMMEVKTFWVWQLIMVMVMMTMVNTYYIGLLMIMITMKTMVMIMMTMMVA